jgi:nucleoside-diphosphate-sugar epimerase
VNTKGAYHVMKAAAELGIKKVLHSGPELIINHYHYNFDIDDVPQAPGTGYYFVTKHLSMEICQAFARAHDIQTVCFQFNRLGEKPTEPITGEDFPPFMIVWDDLVEACRLAIEIPSVPDNFQSFNLHSHLGQGKYSIEKARRMLGYAPQEPVERFYQRSVP